MRPTVPLLSAALLLAALAGTASASGTSSAAAPAHCPHAATVTVPGAAQLDAASCLPDLTTPGLIAAAKTDESDWATLTSVRTAFQPATPGLQLDGYFPDDSTTNGSSGKAHDAQFVMRFPDRWNGKLVITGAPGVRKQYAVDRAISDWAVAHGYAYASTDKGNTGNSFYDNGPTRTKPGDAVAEWHQRVTELTRAAKTTTQRVYGKAPRRTYMTGISNGGYLTRMAVERHPELYDGAVDWEGTLFSRDHNLFTYLPTALAHYPAYQATGSKTDHDALIEAGLAPGSESLWAEHYGVYWDLTQRSYRQEFDPGYSPVAGGLPFCQLPASAGCDTAYDYASRPKAVKDAVARKDVSLTGKIGVKVLTLHGTLDSLLPIAEDSDVYDRMVKKAGRGALHRYYRITDGNHVDSFADTSGGRVRPVLPCYYAALAALDAWVEKGTAPPRSGTVGRVPGQTADQEANTCRLPR